MEALEAQIKTLAVSLSEQIIQSLSWSMLPILDFVQYIDVSMTPSEDCKSDAAHKKKYIGLMNVFTFPHNPEVVDGTPEDIGEAFRSLCSNNFLFDWSGCNEDASYGPLQRFLRSVGVIAIVVGNGTGLPDGLLYNVDIFSLKRNLTIRSDELRKDGSEPKLLFRLKGRTDLIVVRDADCAMTNANIKYFIEVKTVKGMMNMPSSIREAILQLIGGNVAALYHSPPVLLTNLDKTHYVLYIEKNDDDTFSRYKLRVKKWGSFCEALAFVEARTEDFVCATREFGCMPTPPSSVAGRAAAATHQTESDLEDRIESVNEFDDDD